MGIASLFCFGITLGPVAMALGRSDLRAMAEGRKDPSGRGLAQAGHTCGAVGTILGLGAWGFLYLGR